MADPGEQDSRPRRRPWGTVALVVVLAGAVAALLLLVRDPGGPVDPGSGTAATPLPTPSASTPAPPPPLPPTPTPSVVPTAPGEVCVPTSTSTPLRVVTFNIKSGFYGGRSRLDEIAGVLRAVDPDVVFLQEVDRGRPTSQRIDEPTYLGEALGMQSAFGANVQRPDGGQYGTAILSRLPLGDVVNSPLPTRAGLQPRGVLRATIRVGDQDVALYGTHLSNTLFGSPLQAASRAARVDQAAAIAVAVEADPRPAILGGDFNDLARSEALGKLRGVMTDAWRRVGSGTGETAPAGNPRLRIDFLFHDGGDSERADLDPVQAQVLGPSASDHRPLVVDYVLTTDDGDVCVPTLPSPVG